MSWRVLIVEDEDLIAENLESMVRNAGHSVCGKARSAPGALMLAKTELPDIVFMDVKLAGAKDGIDTAQRISESIGCGIVFVTAHASVATRVMIRSFIPAAEVVTKPVLWSEIEAACQRVSANAG